MLFKCFSDIRKMNLGWPWINSGYKLSSGYLLSVTATARRKTSFKLNFSQFLKKFNLHHLLSESASDWGQWPRRVLLLCIVLGNSFLCTTKIFVSNTRFGYCIVVLIPKYQNDFNSKSIKIVKCQYNPYKNFMMNAFQWLCGLMYYYSFTLLSCLVWCLGCCPAQKNPVFWS